jgi:subfamily B ATP-binding cassette protein MsbA
MRPASARPDETPEGGDPKEAKKKRPDAASLKRAFRDIIWPRRKLIGLGLGLILINRLAGLVLPASTKYLIDSVITGGNADLLYPLLGGLAIAIILQAATSFALTRILSVEAQHLIAKLRSDVQKHVLRLPVRRLETT